MTVVEAGARPEGGADGWSGAGEGGGARDGDRAREGSRAGDGGRAEEGGHARHGGRAGEGGGARDGGSERTRTHVLQIARLGSRFGRRLFSAYKRTRDGWSRARRNPFGEIFASSRSRT